jgi:transcriptional regulator with XRE-family HTH domain
MTARSPRRRLPPIRYATLDAYLTNTGESQASVAAAVGTSQAHISRIRHGLIVPRPKLAARLAAYAHIPLDSFTRVHLARTEEVA